MTPTRDAAPVGQEDLIWAYMTAVAHAGPWGDGPQATTASNRAAVLAAVDAGLTVTVVARHTETITGMTWLRYLRGRAAWELVEWVAGGIPVDLVARFLAHDSSLSFAALLHTLDEEVALPSQDARVRWAHLIGPLERIMAAQDICRDQVGESTEPWFMVRQALKVADLTGTDDPTILAWLFVLELWDSRDPGLSLVDGKTRNIAREVRDWRDRTGTAGLRRLEAGFSRAEVCAMAAFDPDDPRLPTEEQIIVMTALRR